MLGDDRLAKDATANEHGSTRVVNSNELNNWTSFEANPRLSLVMSLDLTKVLSAAKRITFPKSLESAHC